MRHESIKIRVFLGLLALLSVAGMGAYDTLGNLKSGIGPSDDITTTGDITCGGLTVTDGITAAVIPLADTYANLDDLVPANGQIVYLTDTKALVYGDGTKAVSALPKVIPIKANLPNVTICTPDDDIAVIYNAITDGTAAARKTVLLTPGYYALTAIIQMSQYVDLIGLTGNPNDVVLEMSTSITAAGVITTMAATTAERDDSYSYILKGITVSNTSTDTTYATCFGSGTTSITVKTRRLVVDCIFKSVGKIAVTCGTNLQQNNAEDLFINCTFIAKQNALYAGPSATNAPSIRFVNCGFYSDAYVAADAIFSATVAAASIGRGTYYFDGCYFYAKCDATGVTDSSATAYAIEAFSQPTVESNKYFNNCRYYYNSVKNGSGTMLGAAFFLNDAEHTIYVNGGQVLTSVGSDAISNAAGKIVVDDAFIYNDADVTGTVYTQPKRYTILTDADGKTVTIAEAGSINYMTGAGTWTLPDASTCIGKPFMFIKSTADDTYIDPLTEAIVYSTLSADDRLLGTTEVGSMVELTPVADNLWYVTRMIGTWSDGN